MQPGTDSDGLPVAIGMPLGLIAVAFLLRRYWRRERGPAPDESAA